MLKRTQLPVQTLFGSTTGISVSPSVSGAHDSLIIINFSQNGLLIEWPAQLCSHSLVDIGYLITSVDAYKMGLAS